MIALSAILHFLIVVACMWVMNLISKSCSHSSRIYRILLALVAAPYAIKMVERIVADDIPTFVDIWGEASFLALLLLTIYSQTDRLKTI